MNLKPGIDLTRTPIMDDAAAVLVKMTRRMSQRINYGEVVRVFGGNSDKAIDVIDFLLVNGHIFRVVEKGSNGFDQSAFQATEAKSVSGVIHPVP